MGRRCRYDPRTNCFPGSQLPVPAKIRDFRSAVQYFHGPTAYRGLIGENSCLGGTALLERVRSYGAFDRCLSCAHTLCTAPISVTAAARDEGTTHLPISCRAAGTRILGSRSILVAHHCGAEFALVYVLLGLGPPASDSILPRFRLLLKSR